MMSGSNPPPKKRQKENGCECFPLSFFHGAPPGVSQCEHHKPVRSATHDFLLKSC